MFSRKLQSRLGGPTAVEFYQETPNYNFHFCYINNNKNYIINTVEQLFNGKKATMFVNKERFVIHKANQTCTPKQIITPPHGEVSIQTNITQFIETNYPKQKFLSIVFDILAKQNLINDDLIFVDFPNIHVADFSSYINNRFDKNNNNRLIGLCKFLQKKNIKFPIVCIRNPLARKYLCN